MMESQLQKAPIGVLEIGHDGQISAVNDRAVALLEVEAASLSGSNITESFPRSAAGKLREAFAAGGPAEQSFEEYYPTIDRWLEVTLLPLNNQVTVYLRDISGRHEDRQAIDRLKRRLNRLERIDTLVSTLLNDLISASSRAEIGRTICERLAEADLYEFTWVGERDRSTGQLRVLSAPAVSSEIREGIEAGFGANQPLAERQAVDTARTQVVESLPDADALPEELRTVAFSKGVRSVVAVPLKYDETVYGVLGVYSARSDGFSTQECNSLETLGAVAGFAINAIRQEDLLFAERVTELRLSVRSPNIPLLEAARAADVTLSLIGAVPQEHGNVVCYIEAELPAEELTETLVEQPSVVRTRVVQQGSATATVEAEVSEGLAIGRLLSWGANIRSAEYADRTARIVADLPPGSDVRSLVSQVEDAFDAVEVTAKKQVSRESEPGQGFETRFEERLTDRERSVLRVAYLADYFTSPRGSTSEEVAKALDITGPTVLYHLRKAQRKLLEAFFAADGAAAPSPDTESPAKTDAGRD